MDPLFATFTQLRDPRKATVVEYNRNGLRNPSPTLTVSGTALSLPLDTIILGLFVMRHDDLNARKRGKAIANIISAGAGGGPF
ncbi:hypothetical protein DL93DRAFT_2078940 [Clavulina sp. PMI_390]|nr:hypothetical protein DL93DRAFT_2078940 [Clavulina sp. PMI_390]